eukprot:5783726-Pyramimonas_sp.AAC.1
MSKKEKKGGKDKKGKEENLAPENDIPLLIECIKYASSCGFSQGTYSTWERALNVPITLTFWTGAPTVKVVNMPHGSCFNESFAPTLPA